MPTSVNPDILVSTVRTRRTRSDILIMEGDVDAAARFTTGYVPLAVQRIVGEIWYYQGLRSGCCNKCTSTVGNCNFTFKSYKKYLFRLI